MSLLNPRRLGALALKETRQILRDPSSLAIAFIMPVVLLFLFGFGVTLDARNVAVGFVLDSRQDSVVGLFDAFAASDSFRIHAYRSRNEAEHDLMAGRLKGLITARNGLAQAYQPQQEAPVQVIVDGTDANTARLIQGYAAGVLGNWQEGRMREDGKPATSGGVVIEQQVWFNPGVRSTNFLMPGLIGIVMTLTGTLLTALLVAREYDRGTLEALMVSPATIPEILLGKLIPTFVLGLIGMGLSVLISVLFFEVPFRGSVAALLLVSSLFMIAALGMGLLISSLAKNQFIAGQIAIVAGFLPAFLLSGFVFAIDGMPGPIQALTHIVAARYLVATLQTLFAAGTVASVLWSNLLGLTIIALVFVAVSVHVTHKRLD